MANETNRRKLWIIALGTCLLVLLSALVALQAFNLKFLNPATTEQIFVFTGLSIVAFLLFVTVLILLARNVLKLYAEQRSRVMGTRLRTRMLVGAILVSLLPISFMAFFSYGLMNRAVDRWFSQPVTQMRDASNSMAVDLAQYTTANARAEADSIATSLPATNEVPNNSQRRDAIYSVLRGHEITLQNGFAIVYSDGSPLVSFQMPLRDGVAAQIKPWLTEPGVGRNGENAARHELQDGPTDAAILATAKRSDEPIFSIGTTDYALGATTLKSGETIVVGLPMPYGMSSTMASLRTSAESYWTVYRSRNQIRNLYMLLLLMMTCLALFASSWLALHLSKQVTKPVEALADAMEAIASGDYAHRVGESATEELGELVRSFNHMAADLEGSRRAVEHSTVQLSAANTALEARRSELETMLETIPNGVATLDSERRIILANRALIEMIDPGGQRPFIGRLMEEVFPQEVVEVLDRLIKRSHRMGSASNEIEVSSIAHDRFSGAINLLATVALLEMPTIADRMHRGYVLVIENATELLRAQKQSAWKEVARRVAHEIKNPLTPISLSAEQIRRHIDRLGNVLVEHEIPSQSTVIIRRCSEVITSSVESMRSLVDQFAALAEFPTAQPRPADLNTIVENSLALFAGRMTTIRIIRKMESDLPLVMADPEALKRALGNLIDNAAEAMQQSLLRELTISTMLLENNIVELTIADTGSGLTDEMRERLFLPYFSTKQRGTGLGLAIAAKIIQEHQGTVRAEQNDPVGARFIIELKTASSIESGTEPLAAANSNGGAP
ncbi:PAS domain-containing sensor histidine kinase [Edaphobacter acidisoli]|uniref:histidine kinase n=1 Tax=Edaphobacter acidisoli TaxID=2040573 RepID=A0A916RYB9_9BACT|nr:ATP-binding protein [Edaphobacter acidisoli]GGA76351.1 PAS domain-containing sensor histidine kinase [Edaphobacter acidisoli]